MKRGDSVSHFKLAHIVADLVYVPSDVITGVGTVEFLKPLREFPVLGVRATGDDLDQNFIRPGFGNGYRVNLDLK